MWNYKGAVHAIRTLFVVLKGIYGTWLRDCFMQRPFVNGAVVCAILRGSPIPRFQVSRKTYQTMMRNPRRAEFAFSPPLFLGKVEGTTVPFTMLVISSLNPNFPISQTLFRKIFLKKASYGLVSSNRHCFSQPRTPNRAATPTQPPSHHASRINIHIS